MSKNSVAVRIAGNEYKIRSDSDEDALRKIALYVDQSMERVRRGTGTVDSLDVAVLTCLNLGREILALKSSGSGSRSGNTKAQLADETLLRSLIERVESAIPESRNSEDDSQAETDERGEVLGASVDAESEEPLTNGLEPSVGEVKTFELPSVEGIRDRDASGRSAAAHHSDHADADEPNVAEPRAAAGGRERAS